MTKSVQEKDASDRYAMANRPVATGWLLDRTGLWQLLHIALPAIISTGFFSLQLFIDRTMLFAYSNDSAAAAMGAGSIYWTMICFPTGLIGFVYAFVAQYYGANREDRIGLAFWQAIWLGLMATPLFIAGFIAAPWFFSQLQHPANITALEAGYFRYLTIGGLGAVLNAALYGFFSGLGRTKTVMIVDAICTVINLGLDAVLIFGLGPFPELGIEGAAIATSVATWAHIPILAWAMFRNENIQRFGLLQGRRWDSPLALRILRYGWPAGVQMLGESAAFAIIMTNVGQLGELPLAATTLALGVNMLAFIPMMGLSMAVSVLVGQRLTEQRLDLAIRTVRTGLLISGLYTGTFAILYGGFPDLMLSMYEAVSEPERFNEIRPMLRPLLMFIAAYCIFDGFQLIFCGAIKGAGDTLYVLVGTVATSKGATAVGLIGAAIYGPSLHWWWWIVTAWVFCMLIAFGLRYWQGKWQTMRVIEQSVTD